MALSDRIRRFRERLESGELTDEGQDVEEETGPGAAPSSRPSAALRRLRKRVESGKERTADLSQRARADLRRVERRLDRPIADIEHEARETRREAGLLGQTVAAPVRRKASAVSDELREQRDRAARLAQQLPDESRVEELRDELDGLTDEFGGLNTDLDDLGGAVEQPLFFEAIDDVDDDMDMFDIEDPVEALEDATGDGIEDDVGIDEDFYDDL